ncbi:MAG: aspartate/glutamate racemase family protein [Chloroflexi bacterium]|nr:aspartate/glutamate racemase family protein [Chloroflexota bacterium]
MKTIGLIGGMSWTSSAEYYQLINEGISKRLGGVHSAKIVMVSVDFARIEKMQTEGDWQSASNEMITAARQVQAGGADFLLICTNTMHLVADQVQEAIHIPLLHIVDVSAKEIQACGIQTVGLLGTRFTMDMPFYKNRLVEKFNLRVLTPSPSEKERVHKVIYEELVLGKISPDSRLAYLSIIQNLEKQGAEAIILGCTEIGLLIKQSDCKVPLFDTTLIHANAAVEKSLQE